MAEFGDYFEQRRRELGMERADELIKIQALLDTWYPGKIRARRLHEAVLTLEVASSAVANELHLRQVELTGLITVPIKRLIIRQSN